MIIIIIVPTAIFTITTIKMVFVIYTVSDRQMEFNLKKSMDMINVQIVSSITISKPETMQLEFQNYENNNS